MNGEGSGIAHAVRENGLECSSIEFPNDDVRQAALAYHDVGLSVFPLVDGTKKPEIKWGGKDYDHVQTREEIRNLFPDNKRGVGVRTGIPSENFAVPDFDSMTPWRDLVQNNPSIQRISSMTPVVRSGSRRGVHLWLRSPVPVRNSKLPNGWGDIKGHGGYVAAPPSVHSSGQLYLFADGFKRIYKLSSLDEVAVLGLEEAEYTEERPPYYGVGWERYAILFGPVNQTPERAVYKAPGQNTKHVTYPSRSEAEYSLVVRLVSLGWGYDEVAGLFVKHAGNNTRFASPKDRSGLTGMRWLRYAYEQATEYVEENRRQVHSDLDRLHRYIDEATFPGRTKWTDRAVYKAALEIARMAGKTEDIGISTRQVAEHAGVSQKTAVRSLHRLESTELLVLEKRSDGYNSSKYRIPTNFAQSDSIQFPYGGCTGLSQFGQSASDDSSADAYRYQSLGKTGAELVNFLNHYVGYWFTIAEIDRATSMSRQSVERKLKQLHYAGLTESTDAAWGRKWRSVKHIGPEELEAVAERHGTAGKGARQIGQHKRERANYREVRKMLGQKRN